MKLTGMSFTIKADRPIQKRHYISPGGYKLNNKQFDFCASEGVIDSQDKKKMHFFVHNFDETYSLEIQPIDIWQKFGEFFIYTGENDDPEINIIGVEDIKFYFDNILFACPEPAYISANECIRGIR